MSRRTVTVAVCPGCRAKIVSGLNADWCAWDVALDHGPVDALGEALAVLTGRTTYDLRPGSSPHTRVMEARRAGRIANGRKTWPVHAEHRCGQPLPVAPATAKPWEDPMITPDPPPCIHCGSSWLDHLPGGVIRCVDCGRAQR